MRRLVLTLVLLALIGIPCAAAVVWLQIRGIRGVDVTVRNGGPSPLKNVVVQVTGNDHSIGDLAVGESRTVRVEPKGESHVELTFVDQRGQEQRLIVGGYFERGYQGTIEVELEHDVIKRNEHNVEPKFLY